MTDASHASRRKEWVEGPGTGHAWLASSDDELLYRIESLPAGHCEDDALSAVVASGRHFFIRQEAAKRIEDRGRLEAFEADRHIGQILVRRMRRREDVAYLRKLIRETRHLEVRKAAEAQLMVLQQELA